MKILRILLVCIFSLLMHNYTNASLTMAERSNAQALESHLATIYSHLSKNKDLFSSSPVRKKNVENMINRLRILAEKDTDEGARWKNIADKWEKKIHAITSLSSVTTVHEQREKEEQHNKAEEDKRKELEQEENNNQRNSSLQTEFDTIISAIKDNKATLTKGHIKQYENNIIALVQEKIKISGTSKVDTKDSVGMWRDVYDRILGDKKVDKDDRQAFMQNFDARITELIDGPKEKNLVKDIKKQSELEKLLYDQFIKEFEDHIKSLNNDENWDKDKPDATEEWKEQFAQFYKTNSDIKFIKLVTKKSKFGLESKETTKSVVSIENELLSVFNSAIKDLKIVVPNDEEENNEWTDRVDRLWKNLWLDLMVLART